MLFLSVVHHLTLSLRRRVNLNQSGQASAEYALVLLGAAAIALLLAAWAARTDGIGKLFDAVMDSLIGKVT